MPREEDYNSNLARLLREEGLTASAETTLKGKGKGFGDALIQMGKHTIIVEAKRGQSNAQKAAALDQCEDRLNHGHCNAAIAVCYPDYAEPHLLDAAELAYAVIDADNRVPDWQTGNPAQLAAAIKHAPAQLGNADMAAAMLADEIQKAIRLIGFEQKQDLARALDLPEAQEPRKAAFKGKNAAARYRHALGRWEREKYDNAAVRGLLVIASAMMFHARLDGHLKDNAPEFDARLPGNQPYDAADWPPAKAKECAAARNPVDAYTAAWDEILALDYKPVFQTAIAGINGPDYDHNWRKAVEIVAQAARDLIGDLAGGRHDVMGRIFHRVLDTAPYDGSFYTGTAGAALLATLAIRQPDRDWSDLDGLRDYIVIDPAGGTGTLPIAAAERIRELAGAAGASDVDGLSRLLVENALHVYDINLTATHMAATTMGLMSPSTQFRNMNVHRVPLAPPKRDGKGVQTAPAYVGSLEWLDDSPPLVAWPDPARPAQIDTQESHPLPKADLFIMNPPFTRDSLRFDQFTPAEERAIKARESELLKDTPAHKTNAAGGFMMLAYKNLKPDGRIAVILPLVGAQNKSGDPVRRLLGKGMHVEYVIAIKDPEDMAFSENTDIGEMLVIAKRRIPKDDDSTKFVKMLRKPKTAAQGYAIGKAILRGEGHDDYRITEWPQAHMAIGDWFPTQFVRTECEEFFQRLEADEWFPIAKDKYIGNLGADGRGIRGAYSPVDESQTRYAIWYHDTDTQTTMAVSPDSYSYIKAKSGKEKTAARYWERRGSVMLPPRLSVPNTIITTLYADKPTVGSAFVPYRPIAGGHSQESVDKACVAYLNSSVGITALLGVTSNKKIVYPNWSVRDHYRIPFPSWGKLSAAQVEALAGAYDELAHTPMLPLREMLGCEARGRLDAAVGAALGVPWDAVELLRVALASEPAVTGRTFTGRAG